MIIDSGHRRWALGTAAALLVCGALYWLAARKAPSGPRGGSWPGLAFGVAGAGLIVFAALLGERRRRPAWRVGRAASWMKGHIWLGLLSVPLILFHGGFSIGGPLTACLLALLVAVVGSGLFGLALQQFLPRAMTERVPLETIYEEIPHVLEQLRDEADETMGAVCGDLGLAPPVTATAHAGAPAAAGDHHPPTPEEASERRARHRASANAAGASREAVEGSGPLREFYLTRARAFLRAKGGADPELSRKDSTEALFSRLRTLLPAAVHDALDELADICEERRQLAVQERLHMLLHGWLLVHAPLTMALLVLTALHAVWALRY